MALPAKGDIETALNNLTAVAEEDALKRNSRQLFRRIQAIASQIENMYPGTYADLTFDEAFDGS